MILVATSATTEDAELGLQTKVLDLTEKLRRLTKWLIVLTVVLVVLGVAALLVEIFRDPLVRVRFPTPPAHALSTLAHAPSRNRVVTSETTAPLAEEG
jgi:peptidoglycan/LPS O-acetylase OafA/YrhL